MSVLRGFQKCHPIAKGAAADAAFGAAANATGGGNTTVVHTGGANRSGSANRSAGANHTQQHQKAKKSRR
jgi:hypothetical protein